MSAAIGALAVGALAAGCQTAGAQSASPDAGTTTITVAAAPGIDDAPLYLAVKDGLFQSAGLEVKIRPYQSVGQELQALAGGQADVAAGDYVDFFYAEATQHVNLHVVADGYHAAPGVMEVLTLPSSGITTPQDLEGKTIGTPEPQLIPVQKSAPVPYSVETVAAQSVLDNDGVNATQLSPARQVKWRPMPSGDLINALANHQVNAILIQEPYIYQAESKLGAIEVLDACSGATASLPLSGYFAVQSFAHKNPDALQDFRAALQRAQADAVQPGPVEAMLAHNSGMPMGTASLVTIGAYPTSLDAASLQRVAGLMFSFGVLVRTLDVTGMVGP